MTNKDKVEIKKYMKLLGKVSLIADDMMEFASKIPESKLSDMMQSLASDIEWKVNDEKSLKIIKELANLGITEYLPKDSKGVISMNDLDKLIKSISFKSKKR